MSKSDDYNANPDDCTAYLNTLYGDFDMIDL